MEQDYDDDVQNMEDALNAFDEDDDATVTTTTTKRLDRGNRRFLPMTGEPMTAAKLNRMHMVKISRVQAPRGMGGYWGQLSWDITKSQLAEAAGAGNFDCMWVDRRGRMVHEDTIDIALDAQGVQNRPRSDGSNGGTANLHALRDSHNAVYAQLREASKGLTEAHTNSATLARQENDQRMERDRMANERELDRERSRAQSAEERHDRQMQAEQARFDRIALAEQTRTDNERAREGEMWTRILLLMQTNQGENGVDTLVKGIELGSNMEQQDPVVAAIAEGTKGISNLMELRTETLKAKNGKGDGKKGKTPKTRRLSAGDRDDDAETKTKPGQPEMAEILAFRAECKAKNIDPREYIRSTTDAIRDASEEELKEMLGVDEEEEEEEKTDGNGKSPAELAGREHSGVSGTA